VASSADGTKLIACVEYGRIYTSSDSGVVWTARESSRFWIAVASSSNGAKLAACDYGGQIYTYDAGAIASGYLSGSQGGTVELLYVGGDTFLTLSYVGSLSHN
jgi:hypothetical protein